jgi:hypothetical protein
VQRRDKALAEDARTEAASAAAAAKKRSGVISDKAQANIDAENQVDELSQECLLNHDQAACEAMKQVKVNYGNAFTEFEQSPAWFKVLAFDALCEMATMGGCTAVIQAQLGFAVLGDAGQIFGNLSRGDAGNKGVTLDQTWEYAWEGTPFFFLPGPVKKLLNP